MKIKKVLALLTSSIIAVASLASCSLKKEPPVYNLTKKQIHKIGIVQLMEHSSLNTIRDSVVDQLAELGYVEGENCSIACEHADGKATTIEHILEQFKEDEMDVVIAISTTCAQLAASYTEDFPVVFSAVTDPVGTGVITSLKGSDKNITGTSDKLPVDSILDFALELKPDIKKLGYLYNANEDNSVSSLIEVKEYCKAKGIRVIEANGMNNSELQKAAEKLAENCDAVFAPNDNAVANSMNTITHVFDKAKIPMIVSSGSMVEDGGLAAIAIEYAELGKETANMVAQILDGEKTASEIPVKVFDKDFKKFVNTDTAEDLGIKIPAEVLNDKDTIVLK